MSASVSARPAIWCLGGAVWDRKLRLQAPVAWASSNPVLESATAGGVARNVAHNLRLLGLPVQLLSAWGDDPAGQQLQADCEKLGFGLKHTLRRKGQASGSYSAVLHPDGELLLGLAQFDALAALDPKALRRSAALRARAPLQLADMNLRADTLNAWLAEPRDGRAVLLAVSEPKMEKLPTDLSSLDLLIANAGEWRAAGGPARLAQRGLRQALVTQGGQGVRCGQFKNGRWHWLELSAPKVPAVLDATGAGDAFAAGVLAALARGVTQLPRAAAFGQKLAAQCLQSLHSVAPELHPGFLEELQDAP